MKKYQSPNDISKKRNFSYFLTFGHDFDTIEFETMGTFKIEITAVGGHGVDRDKKDGETVNFFSEGNHTPDAIGKSIETLLRVHGCDVQEAKIVHWPGADDEVTDDLITGKRSGNF